MNPTPIRCPACGNAFVTDLNLVLCRFPLCMSDVGSNGLKIRADETPEDAAARLYDSVEAELDAIPETDEQRQERIEGDKADSDLSR